MSVQTSTITNDQDSIRNTVFVDRETHMSSITDQNATYDNIDRDETPPIHRSKLSDARDGCTDKFESDVNQIGRHIGKEDYLRYVLRWYIFRKQRTTQWNQHHKLHNISSPNIEEARIGMTSKNTTLLGTTIEQYSRGKKEQDEKQSHMTKRN